MSMTVKMWYFHICVLKISILYMAPLLPSFSFGYYVGTHDNILCQRKNYTLPCIHQIGPSDENVTDCEVAPIPQNDCHYYGVSKNFEPVNLPFSLEIYKFKHDVLRTVSLNISFPHPEWKTMTFQLRNRNLPRYKICRQFRLIREAAIEILSTLYWDCLVFDVDNFEENFFDLYLQNDLNIGGVYSFKAPSLQHYDIESTNITEWHVFFFVHQHYMESTGKLVVTLQPAPFQNISYAVSLIQCLNQSLECTETTVLQSVFVIQESLKNDGDASFTVELQSVETPGTYAASVRILSSLCKEQRCATSMSPPFTISQSYTAIIVLGFIGVVLVISFITFLFMRKLHIQFYDYIEKKSKRMDSVLFVYHANTEEQFVLFKFLSRLFLDKLCVQPLLVDEHVGIKDPNVWTRHQLCHASKVLFFVPRNPKRGSATPIQNQWHNANSYFSGGFFKDHQNVSARFAVVTLPDSKPLVQGDGIYHLRRFSLTNDLASIADWLHRSRALDRHLFWRQISKSLYKNLRSVVAYARDPLSNHRPEFLLYDNGVLRNNKIIIINGDTSKNDKILDDLDELDLEERQILNDLDEKIRTEFDPLLPGVLPHSDTSSSGDELTDGDDLSEDDAMNFAS